MSEFSKKLYLGDGVYVCVDRSGGLMMTTETGVTVTNTIYLDPAVYRALKAYVDAMFNGRGKER